MAYTPEGKFQANLVRRIKKEFPNSLVLRNDAGYMQGVPDLLVLVGPRWFALEVKRSADAPVRPNQRYYVEHLCEIGGRAWFVYPENEEDVIAAMRSAS